MKTTTIELPDHVELPFSCQAEYPESVSLTHL